MRVAGLKRFVSPKRAVACCLSVSPPMPSDHRERCDRFSIGAHIGQTKLPETIVINFALRQAR
jgi:hypothetical protein